MDLEERIFRTVAIVDERGYNLSLPKLSEQLVGGLEDPKKIEKAILRSERLSIRDGYVGLNGGIKDECIARFGQDSELGKIYRKIAKSFCEDLARRNDDIRTIAIGGSLASNGLCKGEDIDLNIVVKDGRKYSIYLLTLYLGTRYAFRHRDLSGDRYLWTIPKLFCVNVIWEESQVTPFERKDEQMAYELINTEVMVGREYYDRMISSNPWLNEIYPQVRKDEVPPLDRPERISSIEVREHISRFIVFFLFGLVRLSRIGNRKKIMRMDRTEKVKHPYGIFDDPSKGVS